MPRSPERLVTLPDGRTLGFDTFGPENGSPLLFFHGAPASRLYWGFLQADRLLEEYGVRVFAPDRPGIGASTAQPERTHLSWVEDVRAFVDALALERVSILAHSGGGPYALACAIHLSERLRAVAVVAGTPTRYPPRFRDGKDDGSIWFLRLCAQRPRLARSLLQAIRWTVQLTPNALMEPATRILPTSDAEIMAVPELRDLFEAMVETTFEQGTAGAQHDCALTYGPWDLPLESVRLPVHLWYGSEDLQVPAEVGSYFRQRIPGSVLRVGPGDGHLSILSRRAGDVLAALSS